jgi:methyl-accepting chemotaxis protein
MNALNNMSIRKKLLLAFAPVLAITISLGLFSLDRLDSINEAAAEMRDHRLPAAEALGTMHAAVERLRANQNIMSGDVTAEMRKTVQGRADGQVKIFDDALASYLPVVLPGDERKLADALVAAWERYKSGSTEFYRLLANDGREKGFGYLMTDMQTSVDALRKALQDDKEYNRQAGRAGAEYGAALAHSARLWIVAVLALSVVICVLIALTMTRALASPIISLREAMRRLARHELSTEVTGLGRQDEIGAMADAVQVFRPI